MELSKVKLTTSSVSTMLGVTSRTVNCWCAKGKVRSEQKGKMGEYYIFADSLVDFLYRNPKHANPYLEKPMRGVTYILQSAIRSELEKLPKNYSVQQVADRYGLTDNAIRHWEIAGLLNNTARKEEVKGIFEKDLEEFFQKNPGIAKRYIKHEDDNDGKAQGFVAV